MNIEYWASSQGQKRLKLFIKQGLKFAIVGVLNTLVYLLLYTFTRSVLKFPLEIANPLCYGIAFCQSFFLNKLWTFKGKKSILKEFTFFALVAMGAWGLQFGIFMASYHGHLGGFFLSSENLNIFLSFLEENFPQIGFTHLRNQEAFLFYEEVLATFLGMVVYTISGFLGHKYISFK